MLLELNHLVPCAKNTNEFLKSFSLEKLNTSFNYTDKYKKLICADDLEENVLFFKSLGYQTRGMSKPFYSQFTNDTLYFKLEDLEKAYKFLSTDMQNNVKHLQKNFRDNFMQNFIEGKSIFYVNW